MHLKCLKLHVYNTLKCSITYSYIAITSHNFDDRLKFVTGSYHVPPRSLSIAGRNKQHGRTQRVMFANSVTPRRSVVARASNFNTTNQYDKRSPGEFFYPYKIKYILMYTVSRVRTVWKHRHRLSRFYRNTHHVGHIYNTRYNRNVF